MLMNTVILSLQGINITGPTGYKGMQGPKGRSGRMVIL